MDQDQSAYNDGLPGQCYMAAVRLARELVRLANISDVRICHGVVSRGPIGSGRIGHAWVEFQIQTIPGGPMRMVMDASSTQRSCPLVVSSSAYYMVGRVVDANVRRYTLQESLDLISQLQHFGPWEAPLERADDWTEVDEARMQGGLYVDDSDWPEEIKAMVASIGLTMEQAIEKMTYKGGLSLNRLFGLECG